MQEVLLYLNGPTEVKKYHPKMFVLDVSMVMPILSANVDRPITGNVLKYQFENTPYTIINYTIEQLNREGMGRSCL